jgi:hypothetical protein
VLLLRKRNWLFWPTSTKRWNLIYPRKVRPHFEGDYVTPIIDGRECAYAFYDEAKTLKCGIEQAYYDGKIDFKKPISCHLYPIRVTKYEQYHALNYDRWSICKDACSLGDHLGVPVYKFLKEPLIRAYGADWYAQLEVEAEEVLQRNAGKV